MREGWRIRKLGDFADLQRGLTYSKGDEVPFSSKCVLRSNNIDLESAKLDLTELKYLRDDFAIPDDRKVKKNSIFICMSNGSKQHVGKVAFIDTDIDYAFGGFMGLIVPKEGIAPKYVFYSCQSSAYRLFLSSIGNGIGITNLRFTDLANYSLPVPPIAEQEKIVAELDCLTDIIEKMKQQLEELDKLAQSIFYDMFGDPESSSFPVKTLDGLSRTKLSYGSGASAIPYDGKLRYVRITDIDENGNLNDDIVSPSTFDEKYLLHEGDLLFARSGATVGKTYLYRAADGDAIFAGYLIRVVPDTRFVLPNYLFSFTKTGFYRRFIGLNAQAVAQPNINAKQYGSLKVVVPPLELQNEFAKKIEAIEKQKELVKQSIVETETLFNSRMDYWFNN